MITYLILPTATGDIGPATLSAGPDFVAARALLSAHPEYGTPAAFDWNHPVSQIGEFLDEFQGEIADLATITLPTGASAWVASYHEGSGDAGQEWMSNIEHHETNLPGLIAALGIVIYASSGFYTPQPKILR